MAPLLAPASIRRLDSLKQLRAEIAKLTGLRFVIARNKFTVQGAHDALVQLSGTLRTLTG